MLEDYWLHTYFEDPKAVTDVVEDDDFDAENVADMLDNYPAQQQSMPLPDDFEDMT